MSSNKQMHPLETLGFKKISHAISKLCIRGIKVTLWKDDNGVPEFEVECDRQEFDDVFTKMLVVARERGIANEDKAYFSFGQFQIGNGKVSDPMLYVFIHYETEPRYTKRSNN